MDGKPKSDKTPVRRLEPAQRASLLRRRMHKGALNDNMSAINQAMQSLYDVNNGPLVSNGVNRPDTFGPFVETAAIAAVRGHVEISDEMWDNILHLWKGYGLLKADLDQVAELLNACNDIDELQVAQEKASDLLLHTSLHGRVKLLRHAGK